MLEGHDLLIFGLCCTGKCFNYSKTVIAIFWYHCDAVDAQLVVDDALGMTSSAGRWNTRSLCFEFCDIFLLKRNVLGGNQVRL